MKTIKKFFGKLARFFTGGGAERAFNTVADLIPKALPVVETIIKLTPTRSDDEILGAYHAYGVPADVALIRATPGADRGYLLLKLATEALKRELPGLATNIANAAVQFAVTALKAK